MVYLGKRQTYGDPYDDGYYHGNWWYSDTAEVIKWTVLAAILFGIFLFLALGWVHAKRRVRRGQAPLRYHRWLLPRAQRRYPPTQPFTFYQHQQNPYEMHPYPAPPPAYRNNDGPPPPQYEPPQGASKMNPNQQTFPPEPPQAGEASSAGPASAAPEHQQAPAERFDPVPLQGNELPPRPESSGRSWNPLKRFK